MPQRGRQTIFAYLLVTTLLCGVFVFRAAPAQAYTKQRDNQLQVGNTSSARVSLFDGKFKGGATVAAADVDGDGIDEYIVGAGATGGSQVQIYNQALTRLSQFYAYESGMKDGINVAAGDLDGDGRAEIVVGPQAGTKPEVRVYTSAGTLIRKFIAFEANFTGGVNVSVIPAHATASGSIVVSSGFGREAEVRVYDQTGTTVSATILPFSKASSNGATVAAGWSDTFGQSIVVVAAGPGERPLVQIFSASSKEKLAQWLAYPDKIKTGMSVGYRNDIIVTAPSVGGGPDVRTFSARGVLQVSQLVFEHDFRGGLNVAGTTQNGLTTFVVVPTSEPMTANGTGKKIVVSLSRQEMTLYEKGRVVSKRKVSTGKWSTPTPVGSYAVKNKIPVAYSKAYGLYMENWMAFSPDGRYGLHSLPYWKLKSGGKLYEGAAHIGTPVSHGCIRQTLAESKTLYDWAPIGTPVVVEK